MTSVVFFKDVSKRYSDLSSKEFGYDENKLKFTGKSGDVTFEATISNKADTTTGTFSEKYEYKPWNSTFTAEVNTKKEFKGEVSLKEQLPGLKATATTAVNEKGATTTAAVEYKRDQAAVTGSVDIGDAKGSNIKASATLGVWKNLLFGGSVHYVYGSKLAMKDVKMSAAWNTEEYDANLFGSIKAVENSEKTEVGVNYFHKVNSNLSVGTEITLDPHGTDPKKDTSMTFATQYKIDANATVKTKVDVTGKIGFSFNQKFNPNTSFTLAALIDTNHFSNKNSSQFGFSVNMD